MSCTKSDTNPVLTVEDMEISKMSGVITTEVLYLF